MGLYFISCVFFILLVICITLVTKYFKLFLRYNTLLFLYIRKIYINFWFEKLWEKLATTELEVQTEEERANFCDLLYARTDIIEEIYELHMIISGANRESESDDSSLSSNSSTEKYYLNVRWTGE